MKTLADKRRQIQTMREAALYKRSFARKLMEEAEEELIQARILEDDLKRGANNE